MKRKGTPEPARMGRGSGSLVVTLRQRILSGKLSPGQFAPTVRSLSEEHGTSAGTAWRALKTLEAEGLVAAHSRHGYRVLARANDPDRGCPIAYVLSAQMPGGEWTGFNRLLLSSLQDAAARRGWSLLGTGAKELSAEAVIEQCRSSRAWGVIVDVHSPELVRLVRKAGLAAVMVDAWHPEADCDTVLQDNALGGMLAAGHLVAAGCRRVGWVGLVTESVHSMDRFSGASMALRKAGVDLPEANIAEVSEADARAAAKKLLSRADRPDGILALWRGAALEVAAAARDLGLEIGRDVKLVGWCADEQYADGWLPHFAPGAVPAAINWSMAALAEAAVARLAERRARPGMAPLRLSVATWLRQEEGRK
ncbi:MAG TPA: GntR family transcriptional regulator [Planctomycetota bacterium]|nr:GntR family transcriptional regulator [Planctomycetota bacterium]